MDDNTKGGNNPVPEGGTKPPINWFVAGWRPFVGWIGALGFAMCVIIYPIVLWACSIWSPSTKISTIDSGLIVTILGGMLGIGTMRTVEKLKNTQGNH